jgi:hypothetical protein
MVAKRKVAFLPDLIPPRTNFPVKNKVKQSGKLNLNMLITIQTIRYNSTILDLYFPNHLTEMAGESLLKYFNAKSVSDVIPTSSEVKIGNKHRHSVDDAR